MSDVSFHVREPVRIAPGQVGKARAMANDLHLATLKARRRLFIARMSVQLTDCCNAAGLDVEATAGALLDALVAAQGRATIRASRSDRIARPCFAAFGDELVPTLRATLGDDLPIAFLARCVDAYWRHVDHVIRHAD